MTVKLCPPFEANYASAANRDSFFNFAEQNILAGYDKRESPPTSSPTESCNSNLFFGFFFDGTRNNYIKADATKGHSNVARLYDCFPGQSVEGVLPATAEWKKDPDNFKNFFRVYIPGVASPFDKVRDSGEGMDETRGAAMGAKGNDRIVWALIQAINNVNRFFLKQPLISSAETTALATRLSLSKEARRGMTRGVEAALYEGPNPIAAPRIEFEALLKRLHSNVSQHWKKKGAPPAKLEPGIVGSIYISTFGFSRGATQARAFANWLDSLCRLDAKIRGEGTLSLGGFPVVFDFLGLFDTVASVGFGNTMGNFLFLKGADGHGGWADAEDSLRIPASINRCVHLVAAHELRRSFPSDSISVGFTMPEKSEEIVFPGVHSDVGGGYVPKEQGKGIDSDGSDMLSRLPLLYMYKQARISGVPLKLELADDVVKARFATTQKTINDFNAYIATCTKVSGRVTDIVREQAILQMAWRYSRRSNGPNPLQKIDSFLRASNFDQNDLDSANKDFDDELRGFENSVAARGKKRPQQQAAGFDNTYDNELEEIATYWPFKQPESEALHFFDEYVHDSRAGFKLTGADTEAAAIEELKKWSKRLAAAKQQYEAQFEGSHALFPPDYGLDTNERKAAEEFDRTGKIPRYYVSGREPYLAAKSGYFRFRKIYGGSDSVLLSNWQPIKNDGRMLADVTAAPKEPESLASKAA
jgi:hypothetical protein